ncbi:MAG: phosphate ABC transporter permease PstA [Gammaproteobacteria bacterium]|nr:phosphate ABC transporter permease PstA [Gammaproteobacteria bacterium]
MARSEPAHLSRHEDGSVIEPPVVRPGLYEGAGWRRSGVPWIWLHGSALTLSLLMVAGLLTLITVKGAAHFWPATLWEYQYRADDGELARLIGIPQYTESAPPQDDGTTPRRTLIKVGNRELLGLDFQWLPERAVVAREQPAGLLTVERLEWGDAYGYPAALWSSEELLDEGEAVWTRLPALLERVAALQQQAREVEDTRIRPNNIELERLRLQGRRLELRGHLDRSASDRVEAERRALLEENAGAEHALAELRRSLMRDRLVLTIADGRTLAVPLSQIVRIYRPNELDIGERLHIYLQRLKEFLTEDPREANTEGGIFPALFGTILMVLTMSVLVTPLGVVTAVYLHEYARQGPLTSIIRIAVNNLAGVPSIVYGVFGLGLFVYVIGGTIDDLFYPEAQPAPTFGTGGLFWASLTLALLTLPVVIVSTEEGLVRVPNSIREASLALGANRIETIWHVLLPAASPAILTGLILAIARAAGEVAPLMLVGVVKLAPSLPVDGYFPYLHLERKFMHLGFHIYDVGFQSPNVEAARPLVYATALLLVAVVIVLNLAATLIRNRLRERSRLSD